MNDIFSFKRNPANNFGNANNDVVKENDSIINNSDKFSKLNCEDAEIIKE
jgi:hypothetical protein